MTDKELLELAAKAAGIEGGFVGDVFALDWADEQDYWNPLTDDGDALRLAVKLGMDVCIGTLFDIEPRILVIVFISDESSETIDVEEPIGKDPYAATRRAIVRAAAEIGRTL